LLIILREQAGLGSRTMQMLLSRFGSLENLISADLGELLELPRITEKKAHAIRNAGQAIGDTHSILQRYSAMGIRVLTILDDDYPQLLREMADSPFVLYYRGHFPLENQRPFIAVVGTTRASAAGIANAVAFARALSVKGAVIVSGLARGIDTAAHIGAIKSEGQTYAVLGCGFNHIYPPENKRLAEEILEKGALISEYPPETQVTTGRLLSRNRIIVGLSHSVVVGEIDKRSRGTLNAVERGKRLGKILFAIGSIESPINPGLVRYGAIPLEDVNQAGMITDHSF